GRAPPARQGCQAHPRAGRAPAGSGRRAPPQPAPRGRVQLQDRIRRSPPPRSPGPALPPGLRRAVRKGADRLRQPAPESSSVFLLFPEHAVHKLPEPGAVATVTISVVLRGFLKTVASAARWSGSPSSDG